MCSGVEMLSPETAAVLFGVPLRWIYRRVESGELHFQEIGAGSLLVCPSSLQTLVQLPAQNLASQHFDNFKNEEK